ncbi:IclR family transcriptional regulator [Bombiscardovia coagulans]|uniref:IclR family transcriptional regulator n=1 Tax=Bombiscardovia coagulans TaxID=686666 RepID=A0A261EQU5_9BIFI|nr:IclR family transcriptional regulator [Bombiscardovia coagulans]OZG49231.1 IclR family transcriptional regulator [Bombiscardovia coagulans]
MAATQESGRASRSGVLDRAFAILSCFTSEEPALTLTQISCRTHLPASTTSRLLKELTFHRALIKDERTGLYSIGFRLMEIAQYAQPMLSIRELASPVLDSLARATEEHIQLGALDGEEMVVLDRREGKHKIPVYYHIGDRLPLVPTAAGRTLLAYAVPETIDAVLAGNQFVWPTWEIPRPSSDEIRTDLERIRQQQVTIIENAHASIHSIASPIFGQTGAVIAAISIVVGADRYHLAKYVPIIKAAAKAIARRIKNPKLPRVLPPWEAGNE